MLCQPFFFFRRIEACFPSAFSFKNIEKQSFLYDVRYLKALLLKLIQLMFRIIFPLPSEGRLNIDFMRILKAMGEDSEQENFLKPYEQIHRMFDVLCSKFRGDGGWKNKRTTQIQVPLANSSFLTKRTSGSQWLLFCLWKTVCLPLL